MNGYHDTQSSTSSGGIRDEEIKLLDFYLVSGRNPSANSEENLHTTMGDLTHISRIQFDERDDSPRIHQALTENRGFRVVLVKS